MGVTHARAGRKKKCDETQPKCYRCIRSGLECGGYAPLDSPDSKGVMRRAKAPPTSKSPNPSVNSSRFSSPQSSGPSRPRKVEFDALPPTEEPASFSTNSRSRNVQIYIDTTRAANDQSDSALVLPTRPSPRSDLPAPLDFNLNTTIQPVALAQFQNNATSRASASPFLPVDQQTASSSGSSSGRSISTRSSSSRSSDMSRRYSSNIRPMNPPLFSNSGQASLFQALFSLAEPENGLPASVLSSSVDLVPHITYGPAWPPLNLGAETRGERSSITDNDDPEGIRQIMCKDITPDPNAPNNALPFVLQSYARWVNFTVFDPLRVIDLIRDNVIAQFSSSQESRKRIILISNVIGTLGKTPELNATGLSLVAVLRAEAHKALEHFHTTMPTGQQDVDKREASKTLDHMIEMILMQRFSSPLSTVFKLMEDAAPVFRRACPEPPEQLVNLPNILLESGLNLRHFAATDVLTSVTTARPMLFKYDVTYTPEMDDRMTNGNFGLQWLHGVPDQFIISLAWINGLYEDFGTAIDPQYVADIEEQVRSVKFTPTVVPAAPFFAVWRLVVQECWRQTVFMYLYMVLCGAQADDPRVLKAVRAFTQLVDGVRPGRNPDSFLFIPIMIAGACAYETQDQNILRRRMLGLRECTNPGTCGHDCLSILLDIWERTEAENRPAVWRDLRIASLKVAGV